MTRRRARLSPWVSVGLQAWALGLESGAVIGLRTLKLAAGGDAAEREARLMVTEKLETALEVQQAAITGALGLDAPTAAKRVVRRYRRKVRANRRRLGG